MTHRKKRSYKTRREVIAACLRANKRTGTPMRPYFCPDCKAYHMTKEKRW